jgi:hypothetical protein
MMKIVPISRGGGVVKLGQGGGLKFVVVLHGASTAYVRTLRHGEGYEVCMGEWEARRFSRERARSVVARVLAEGLPSCYYHAQSVEVAA